MASLLPTWPSAWWVASRPQDTIVIHAMDLDTRRIVLDAPVCRGASWTSHRQLSPESWFEVTAGWWYPYDDRRMVMVGQDLASVQGRTFAGWGEEDVSRYEGGMDSRGRLRWARRLPSSLEPFVNRVIELLGAGQLERDGRYVVDPV